MAHSKTIPENPLQGRSEPIKITEEHFIFNQPIDSPTPEDAKTVLLGMGCYWGAERLLWQQTGVINTSVGFSGGITPNPTYKEVCTGNTGHAEVVKVTYDPSQTSLENLLAKFWERHDPTQGMRQGNDIGTQYRSVIFVDNEEDLLIAQQTKANYQQALNEQSLNTPITTEIALMSEYYFAETEHQQYLAKNPEGYCGLGGVGVCYI